jgi:hypothetical protein
LSTIWDDRNHVSILLDDHVQYKVTTLVHWLLMLSTPQLYSYRPNRTHTLPVSKVQLHVLQFIPIIVGRSLTEHTQYLNFLDYLKWTAEPIYMWKKTNIFFRLSFNLSTVQIRLLLKTLALPWVSILIWLLRRVLLSQ